MYMLEKIKWFGYKYNEKCLQYNHLNEMFLIFILGITS